MITGSALRAWGLLSLLLALLGCAYIFHFSASATPSDVRPFVVADAVHLQTSVALPTLPPRPADGAGGGADEEGAGDALMPQCVERHRHDKVEEHGVNVSGSMRVR